MIESPKNFIEQFQNFIEHIAGVMKTFLTKEVADNYYLGKSEKAVSAGSVQWEGVENVPDNVKNALSFIAQTLTEEQKQQARTNIGALGIATLPSIPAGTLLSFAGTDVPEGYLLCNGANVSRTTYAALFAVIGTKYGDGDGSSTFTLPNLDGRVLQGTNDTGEVGTYLEAKLPNIPGSFSAGSMGFSSPSVSGAFEVGGYSGRHSVDWIENSGNFINFNASRVSSIYSGASMQLPALKTLVCIKF